MVKPDWTSWDDRARAAQGPQVVATPFVGQGVGDALRNAYRRVGDDAPADFAVLLRRLN